MHARLWKFSSNVDCVVVVGSNACNKYTHTHTLIQRWKTQFHPSLCTTAREAHASFKVVSELLAKFFWPLCPPSPSPPPPPTPSTCTPWTTTKAHLLWLNFSIRPSFLHHFDALLCLLPIHEIEKKNRNPLPPTTKDDALDKRNDHPKKNALKINFYRSIFGAVNEPVRKCIRPLSRLQEKKNNKQTIINKSVKMPHPRFDFFLGYFSISFWEHRGGGGHGSVPHHHHNNTTTMWWMIQHNFECWSAFLHVSV